MRRLLSVLAASVALGAFLAPAAGATPGPAPAALGTQDGDPMSYPSSAMGLIVGMYQGHPFNCSGSVVDTPGEATVVMTAGHCAVNEDTGVPATHLAFLPAYRENVTPYGSWNVASVTVDPSWQPAGDDDRAGDISFMTLADHGGWSLKELTGSIGIGFDQPAAQTYTEWGYPEESPYTGEQLVNLTAGLASQGSEWTPASLGIDSDFNPGASGGPWTIGPWSAPTAVSITSYRNDVPDGMIWGPYFGSDVAAIFASVGGDPSGAVPVTPDAQQPRLQLWVSRHGTHTTAHFQVIPHYPLNADIRCMIKGAGWLRCRDSRVVPAGKVLEVKVRYGAPQFRHVLGPRMIRGARLPGHNPRTP